MKCEICEEQESDGYMVGEKETCMDCYSASIDDAHDLQVDKDISEDLKALGHVGTQGTSCS